MNKGKIIHPPPGKNETRRQRNGGSRQAGKSENGKK